MSLSPNVIHHHSDRICLIPFQSAAGCLGPNSWLSSSRDGSSIDSSPILKELDLRTLVKMVAGRNLLSVATVVSHKITKGFRRLGLAAFNTTRRRSKGWGIQ